MAKNAYISRAMLYIYDNLMDFDLGEALEELSPERRERAMQYKFEIDRRCCAVAYLLLRRGLREEYGMEEKPQLEYQANGKPRIAGHPDIHFNWSHCREAVVCAIGDAPVGVDVEAIRQHDNALMEYTMNARELEQIRLSNNPDIEFIKLWTRKEALLKLSGEGLRNDMREVLAGPLPRIETTVGDDGRYAYSIATTPAAHALR